MSNFINITDIDWDIDDECNDLPQNIIVNLNAYDYNKVREQTDRTGDSELLVDLVSDFYGFCIKSLQYDFNVPEGIYLPDIDMDV